MDDSLFSRPQFSHLEIEEFGAEILEQPFSSKPMITHYSQEGMHQTKDVAISGHVHSCISCKYSDGKDRGGGSTHKVTQSSWLSDHRVTDCLPAKASASQSRKAQHSKPRGLGTGNPKIFSLFRSSLPLTTAQGAMVLINTNPNLKQ